MIGRPLILDALRFGVILLAIVLAGCQPRVYLKPTPAAFSTGEHDPFAVNPLLEKTNHVQVLYATNRLPLGLPAARAYTFLPSDIVHLGVATLRIGAEDSTWEELYRLSTSADEADRPLIELENLKEVIRLGEDDDHVRLNPKAQAAFARLNALLARSLDKDIMVYVHGANTNVYRATAQAAQYRHFTGRNSVVVAFAWPSTGTVLRYGTDVANARQTSRSSPASSSFLHGTRTRRTSISSPTARARRSQARGSRSSPRAPAARRPGRCASACASARSTSPRPARRGLEEIRSEKGFVWWTFPTDYEERVIEIVRNLR